MKKSINSSEKGLIALAVFAVLGIGIWAALHFTKKPVYSSVQFFEVKRGVIETEVSEVLLSKQVRILILLLKMAGE